MCATLEHLPKVRVACSLRFSIIHGSVIKLFHLFCKADFHASLLIIINKKLNPVSLAVLDGMF